MPIQYPLINGVRFDFSSVKLTINDVPFVGVSSLNYKATLDPGEARGTAAQLLGRTRGKYTVEGSIELFMSEDDELTDLLTSQGLGIYEQTFTIVANYSEVGSSIVTDTILGARLKTGDRSFKNGSDALVIKRDIHALVLLENNKLPMSAKQMVGI